MYIDIYVHIYISKLKTKRKRWSSYFSLDESRTTFRHEMHFHPQYANTILEFPRNQTLYLDKNSGPKRGLNKVFFCSDGYGFIFGP